jgi:5-methylcytosine-specific restriction endonuclease McrA
MIESVFEAPDGYKDYEGKCPNCGSTLFSYREKGPHMQVRCLSCGSHITFIPKENITTWKKNVKQRDKFICQRCKMVGNSNTVQAHHKMPVWFMPELQFDIDNGITLCKKCHRQLHGASGTIKESED